MTSRCLVDARHGVSADARHCVITSLRGIPKIIVAINKMDLVDWSEEKFEEISGRLRVLRLDLLAREQHFIPMSALEGDVVVEPSPKRPRGHGPELPELLVDRDRRRRPGDAVPDARESS